METLKLTNLNFTFDTFCVKYQNNNSDIWFFDSFSSICQTVYKLFQLIDEKILCVHGGLSPEIKTVDQIRCLERNQEIPHKGAFCDLVWSDPEDVDTWCVNYIKLCDIVLILNFF